MKNYKEGYLFLVYEVFLLLFLCVFVDIRNCDISFIIDFCYYIWKISEDLVFQIVLFLYVYGDYWEDKKKDKEEGCG